MEGIQYFQVLLPIALILIVSKLLMRLCKRVGLPEVIGMLIAGILVGLIKYIPGQDILNDGTNIGIQFLAKIGVILIMFTAGLETDLNQIKKVGGPALVICLAGVLVPLGLGFLIASAFNGGFGALSDKSIVIENLFYGVILTATSVSVTVATLKEAGKLNSRAGSTVVAAAIIDDVVGMIVLSFILAMGGASTGSPYMVIIKTILYFVVIFIITILARMFFNYLAKKFPHHRIVPIFSLAFCFLVAYISEMYFGIADITGAYLVGLILSTNKENEYIEKRSDELSYMLFAPIFFGSIGITMSFEGMTPSRALFGMSFVVIGLLGKVLGCFLAAKSFKYSVNESLIVGVGMMARAEVALISAQKGIDYNVIKPDIMPFIVILIIASSLLTPIFLNLLFKKGSKSDGGGNEAKGTIIDGEAKEINS